MGHTGTGVAALCAAILLTMSLPPAIASSIPGHCYAATRILNQNARLATLVGGEQAAYLAGAAGPDVAFVASDRTHRDSPGAESHYARTGELCLSFLKEARTPAERAFALGWITHWLTDQAIHSLVNAYGGSWEVPAERSRHSQLEVAEVKHVYSVRSTVPGLGSLVLASADVPRDLMRRAFGATYNKPAFAEGGGFEGNLSTAAGFIALSTSFYRDACESGTGQGQGGLMNLALQTYSSKVPTNDQYAALLKPLEFGEVTPGADGLHVKLRVNDVRLYAKFLREWQVAMDAVVSYSPALFGPVLDFVAEPTSARAAQARKVLWTVDLDNPARSPEALAKLRGAMTPLFDLLGDGTLRGDPPVDKLLLLADIAGAGPNELAPIDISGLPTSGFDGSREGEVQFVVPVSAEVLQKGGRYDLWVSIGDRSELVRKDLEGAMWVHTDGTLGPAQDTDRGGYWVLADRKVEVSTARNNPVETFEGGGNATSAWARTTIRPLNGATSTVSSTHQWTELPAFLHPGQPVRITLSAASTGNGTTILREMAVNNLKRVRWAVASAEVARKADGSSQPGQAEVKYEPINPRLDGAFHSRGITPPLTEADTDPKLEMALIVECGNGRGVGVAVTHRYAWRARGGLPLPVPATPAPAVAPTPAPAPAPPVTAAPATPAPRAAIKLAGGSSSAPMPGTYDPARGEIALQLTYTRPGVVLDSVGINAAKSGDFALAIASDGTLVWQVYRPRTTGPLRQANGWHVLRTERKLTLNQASLVQVQYGLPQTRVFVDQELWATSDTHLPLSGSPAFLGDFPGDDRWGARYNIHPSFAGEVRDPQYRPRAD